MFYPSYFFIFESLAFVSFVLIIIREIYQRNYRRIFEIASCAVFGMILEIGNTFLAHTYSYSQNFLVNLAHVPIAIGLGWAVIIYCAMLLSDQYNIPWTLRPFIDAFTAIILDLAMDVVAIRIGFWSWTIPLDKEWYGVPFDNLVGWLFVVLSFSFLIRFIRTLNSKRFITKLLMIFSPILAYGGLLGGIAAFGLWTALPQPELWKLIFLTVLMTHLFNTVVWSLVKYRRRFLKNFDLLSFSLLTGIHLFFIVALFSTGLYHKMPFLILISLGSLFLHLLIHFVPYLVNRETVYLFRMAKKEAEERQEQLNKIIKDNLK